eukprot:6325684-Alexandrium_andersonii.AAC.1
MHMSFHARMRSPLARFRKRLKGPASGGAVDLSSSSEHVSAAASSKAAEETASSTEEASEEAPTAADE